MGKGVIHLGRALRLGRDGALALLRELGCDRAAMADLRRLYAHELGRSAAHLVSDAQVLAQLAERIASGALMAALVRRPVPGAPPEMQASDGGAAEPPPAETAATAAVEDEDAEEQVAATFIELKLVFASGEAAASVRLSVALPSGEVQEITTNESGIARLEPVDEGAYDVRSPWSNGPRAETLTIADSGGSSGDARAEEDGAAEGGGTFTIAVVEQHKVRAGETLAGLAESVGLTWQELARFNFGTDKLEEIHRALRRIVGCTKKTQDGKNYVFSDTDDPGIILLPRAWEQAGLVTGSQHVITVARVVLASKPRPWRFSV